jgi:hypothetical protein
MPHWHILHCYLPHCCPCQRKEPTLGVSGQLSHLNMLAALAAAAVEVYSAWLLLTCFVLLPPLLLLLLQVEVYKYTGDADRDSSAGSSPAVVRACVTKLPPGYSRVEVAQMQDAIWGLDGFDT